MDRLASYDLLAHVNKQVEFYELNKYSHKIGEDSVYDMLDLKTYNAFAMGAVRFAISIIMVGVTRGV